MPGRSVCVVGAGLSGLTSIKESLDTGLEPTCYELDSDIGGIWKARHGLSVQSNVALWKNFTCNFSKWAVAFSTLPPKPQEPPYLDKEAMFRYYKRFATMFGLLDYVQFNVRVVWVRKSPDHATSGTWDVFTCPVKDFQSSMKSLKNVDPQERERVLSSCTKKTFDFVIVCSGYYKVPCYPDISGMSTFKGSIAHSFNYTSHDGFEGKNVLVVGNRISALEIANDISSVASKTYLAIGNGASTIPRHKSRGFSLKSFVSSDLLGMKASTKTFVDLCDLASKGKVDRGILSLLSPQDANLVPNSCINQLVVKIRSGKIQVLGSLSSLSSHEAYFTDGRVTSDIDAIVFCTGYGADMSFLETNVIAANGRMDLFKMVFPAKETQPTLAFVGVLGLDSPFAIVSELQSRLATRIMARLHSLPSQSDMERDAEHWNDVNWHLKGNFKYLLPGYILADSIAREIGVYPSFWKTFVRDPLLAFRVRHGSIISCHYRLLGPGNQWKEARQFCHAQYNEQRHCKATRHLSQELRKDVAVAAYESQWLKLVAAGVVLVTSVFAFNLLKGKVWGMGSSCDEIGN